jgi:hypothetical protein
MAGAEAGHYATPFSSPVVAPWAMDDSYENGGPHPVIGVHNPSYRHGRSSLLPRSVNAEP